MHLFLHGSFRRHPGAVPMQQTTGTKHYKAKNPMDRALFVDQSRRVKT